MEYEYALLLWFFTGFIIGVAITIIREKLKK